MSRAAREFLAGMRDLIDAALDRVLPRESDPPARLNRAMRYSVFAGGKRLRPALVVAAARLGGAEPRGLLDAAAALELLHTYSLIHDDLPAMDDDALRRGRPTCHVAFNEATAILAGDGLLTLTFELLAAYPPGPGLAERRLEAVLRVARAGGCAGMVGGQADDLESHEHSGDLAALVSIHARKTGALMGASLAVGGLLGGLDQASVDRLERFGSQLGLVFQIADDILDVESTPEQLGKTTGKDARTRKLTYPALYGLERAREEARRLQDQALLELEPFGPRGELLRSFVRFVADRQS